MTKGRLQELASSPKRALLIGTYLNGKEKSQCEEQLKELESLGGTFGLEIARKIPIAVRKYEAGAFLGKGKIEEIREHIQEDLIDLIVFDDEMTPQQQRNLEKMWERTVIDRTELILGVFAQRALTREAKIQIELASCRYQLPRLRRLWTHLSRQKTGGSGGGFLKGEGEKQIEIDRRILRRRIDQLQKEIEEVKRHRQTQRRARKRVRIPTFAIIGYTNVGKSTLLRALTDADVLVEDKLFATLDTTTRKFLLPNKQPILLTDTVGFIRKIPHHLIAAFKSTLEEAVQADILLHLIDVSSPAAAMQAEASLAVLKELGAENHPMITVLNKVDRCTEPSRIDQMRVRYPKTVVISALEKRGFEELMEKMIQEISLLRKIICLRIPQSHYAIASEVMREGKVLFCAYEENDVLLEAEIPHSLERKISLFEVAAFR